VPAGWQQEKRKIHSKSETHRVTYSWQGFLRRDFNFVWDSPKHKEISGVDAAACCPLNGNSWVSFMKESYFFGAFSPKKT